MINAIFNGTTYNDVSMLKATDGSTEVNVQLTETGVIPTPTESLTITSNGTYDVTNLAQIIANIAGGTAGNITIETGTYEAVQDTYTISLKKDTDPDTLPIIVAYVLDTETVNGIVSSHNYGGLCWSGVIDMAAKSTSDAWYATSCYAGAGTGISNKDGSIKIQSSIKLYGGTYRWIAVYQN